MSHFSGDTSKHPKRWAELWDKGDFLPFDRGMPNPALVDLLTDRQDFIGSSLVRNGVGGKQRKTALVPGCGRGYDVLLLASFGYDAYGLEVSETAVKRCIEERKTNGDKYPVNDVSIGAGKATFLVGDFFVSDWMKNVEGDGKVDLIYDYTVHMTQLCKILKMRFDVPFESDRILLVSFGSATHLPSCLGSQNVPASGN